MLSCSCSYDDHLDGDNWQYFIPDDFKKLKTIRRRRCSSCKELINIGSDCLEFSRIRSPKTDIEEMIIGDEIPMASWWMCEKCGEQFLNLNELGYCINLEDNMFDLLQEYHEQTGFERQKD